MRSNKNTDISKRLVTTVRVPGSIGTETPWRYGDIGVFDTQYQCIIIKIGGNENTDSSYQIRIEILEV